MIEWMQRHKKWLVVTIWVSVIAFVGAGFVGWGAYDFGKSEGAVAKVGKKEIKMSELQREYGKLYSQYASMFGDSFNREIANQLGLENIAMQTLVQKYLILSFADDLGLVVTDEEVARTLLQIEAFQVDGQFNRDAYIRVLRQQGINKPSEFDEYLKNDLIIEKVQKMFKLENSPQEIEDISSLIFMKNSLNIAIVKQNDVHVQINENDLKDFWEENKNSYLSELSYDIKVYNVANFDGSFSESELKEFYEKTRTDYVFDDGKIKTFEEAYDDLKVAFNLEQTKNDALRKYLLLKKGEMEFDKSLKIAQSTKDMIDYQEEISKLKSGEISKPFIVDNNYVIIQLISTNHPTPLDFDNARELAKDDYLISIAKTKMVEKANELLLSKNLTHIGLVSRESVENIQGLKVEEAVEFLNKLFTEQSKAGVIELEDKVVAYEILDSKLGTHSNTRELIVSNTIMNIKSNEMFTKLLESLEQKYKVISYLK